MERNCKRFLSLLLAFVMVIGMVPMDALAAQDGGPVDLTVTARYATNRLSWTAENGAAVTVERSEDGQTWSEIGTSSNGAYLDTNAGPGTRYYYRVCAGDAVSESVRGAQTGMDALKEIAVLFYAGNDEITFDGTNRVVIADGDKAEVLNAMESGTIVYKATMTNVTNKQGVLGTDNDCYVGAYASKFRHELGGLNGEISYQGMVVGPNTAGFVYDDSNGHWALCANGGAITSVDLNEANFGLLTAVNADTYYAGGSPKYPLNGTINYILVLSEVLTDAELKTLTAMNLDHDEQAVMPLGTNIGMMVEYAGDANNSNTWMFDGGSTTAGSFTQIGSIRNYVYQFEEYVRGVKMAAISTGWNSRQRYTINVGKAGQTLADSLEQFDRRAAELDPRAAVYLVGAEDYHAGAAGLEDFRADLRAYIEKSVKLRSGSGFAMIQTPYPDDTTENDELYAVAVREVLDGLSGSIRGNVVLVDHNSASFDAACYNADGSLSGKGHYEMGRQLAAAVYGNSDRYQNLPDLTPAAAPASYSDAAPSVTSEDNGLVISGLQDLVWTVEIALESYTLTLDASGSDITVENLPAAEEYILTITAADMSVRLPVMAGTVGEGAASEYAPVLNENQQAIADLIGGDEPLTWLFMGDSITHGASYTFGHDSISQLFEKFLKDDLGRVDDIVINTAVSSADTNDTIEQLHARLDRYQPDVVSIMIGTNDSAAHINVGETRYKENLRTIIDAIQQKGARVILRTPVPTKDGSRTNIGDYADWMGQVADEYEDVILVEQYDSMSAVFTVAPYMKSALFNSGDYLHPTTEGQTWMLHRFLEATGLMRDGYLANLSYDNASETVSQIVPPVDFADGTASMNTADLADAYGQSLYLIKLMATDDGGNVYSVEGQAGDILIMSNLPEDVSFTARANLAGSGTWVNFGVPRVMDVEVVVGRTQTVVVDGEVTPNAEGVKDIAQVTAKTMVVAKTGLSNGFSDGYIALTDCAYTFDKQSDGTYLIWAQVDGTAVYVDPHAGAGNTGYPNRTYQSLITLEPGTDGTFKFHQVNEGYLHFWDNDDSKLHWDQCSADGGHTGHNLRIYRRADENEQSSTEVPGYVQVTDAADIVSGGKYLIVARANSGGYYAMQPCKTTANKYQHICKVGGVVTELTIRGLEVGTGTVYAGNNVIHVSVAASASTVITLDYNYDGAPENGKLTVVTGDAIGELPTPMRPGYTFFGWYLNGSKITSTYVVTEPVTLTADWVTVSTKEKPADGTTNGQPFPERFENGNAYCYRIPGIVTLADGTVVAMADARWNTWADCGGLDTIISASRDNGRTWTYTYANYLGDNGDLYNPWSTTFIDPAIATDGETVYMIADLFPAGVSTMAHGYASQAGSGGFNENGKLMLRDLAGDTYKHGNSGEKSAYLSMATSRSYDFYLDPNTDGTYTIRRESDDSAVDGYTVDEMLNIRSEDGSVDTHLFMADSPFQVYPTNYLYLTKSTDGLNWSAPELIVAKTGSESAYLIGPGSGTYDAVHGNMVFTAYSYSGSASSQKTSLLWAGKDGVWHRSENATTDVWSSEASAVVLDDGTVRVFYRSGSNILCYTDYLWVDGEYVRDVENTSVSTEAVKNSGNGCMLSAVKYPEKVNGRQMILVATPATSNSRSDGHIYAFYINKNGTMELVADYDITPGSAEYYAYSCLTVLTSGEEAGDLGLFWEDSWNNSPAAATICYSVIAIADVLAGVKEVVRQDVVLTVGETAAFADPEGYYVGEDTSELNTDVATVEITGTVTETAMAADRAVSTIENGNFILVNTRAGKPVTNGTASADGGNGLSLNGTRDNVEDTAIWTVTAVDGGYTVRDADGKYLTIGSNTAGLSTAETVVQISRNGNTWTISQNGAYLNDFGGKGVCAAGWQHSSAPDDAGSQWQIWTVTEVPVAGTSSITFTGVGVGETSVLIGNTIYNITVTGQTRENPFVDVPDDSFCIDAVLWAVEEGITNGVDATHFNPTGECARAVVVTFLWRAAGEPGHSSTESPFTDVSESDWYYDAVLWAVEKGITTGTSETTFSPAEVCNRATVVTFLYRAMGEPEITDTENPFTDVKADSWYGPAVLWAVENDITNGIGGGLFDVAGVCNRAQVVTFLHRALAG